MNSKIARAIHLTGSPVAVIQTDTVPAGSIQPKKGIWYCVVSMLAAVAKGKTVALRAENVGCPGGCYLSCECRPAFCAGDACKL